jgi:hypothetical protein
MARDSKHVVLSYEFCIILPQPWSVSKHRWSLEGIESIPKYESQIKKKGMPLKAYPLMSATRQEFESRGKQQNAGQQYGNSEYKLPEADRLHYSR